MAFEQVTKINFRQIGVHLLDQRKLLIHHILTVLEREIRESVEHCEDVAGFDLMLHTEIVEETGKV